MRPDCKYILDGKELTYDQFRKRLMADEVLWEKYAGTLIRSFVPDAPFKGNAWKRLAMKRVLAMAAERGYDGIAWTTGAQQNGRYRLSTVVNAVSWGPASFFGGGKDVTLQPNGPAIDFTVLKDGTIRPTSSSAYRFAGRTIDALVGKDLAKQIMGEESGDLRGTALDLDGQGMVGFYDRELPNLANDLIKKYGVTVGTVKIGAAASFKEIRQNIQSGRASDATVHFLELPQAMREDIRAKGLPLFQGEKASVEFAEGGAALIRAMQSPDVSSAVHEIAHVARRFLLDRNLTAEQRAGISDEDIAVAEAWAGATDGKWSVEAEEKFARGFERYLADGVAPTARMKSLFASFKAWLSDIYSTLAGSSIDIEVSDAMKGVYDKLVTRKARAREEQAAAVQPTKPAKAPQAEPKAPRGARARLLDGRTNEAAKAPQPKKQPEGFKKSDWTEIGKNAEGQTLYEDERGVRSYVEDGIRVKEPVALRPTRAGTEIATDRSGSVEWEVAKDEPTREYASTQINLPAALADRVRAVAARIPDAKLAKDGREDTPHVTVLYGLHSDDPSAVKKALAGIDGAHPLNLGEFGFFEGKEADVVYVGFDSTGVPRLSPLLNAIAKSGEFTNDHPKYTPHVTLAYVKPGLGEFYADWLNENDHSLNGASFDVNEIVFSPAEGDPTTIPLGSKADDTVEFEVKPIFGGPSRSVKVAKDPAQARAVIERERAANKADRDRLIAELKANQRNRLSSVGVDPEDVLLMVKIVRTYIKDGILAFREVALQFQEDFGPGARALDEYLETVWEDLRGETVSVEEALADDGRIVEGNAPDADRTGDPEVVGGPEPEAGQEPEGVRDAGQPSGRGPRASQGRPGGRGQSRPEPGAGAGTGDGRGVAGDAPSGVTPAAGAPGPVSVDGAQPSNYRIRQADALGQGGAATKFKQNIAAITLAKQIEADNRPATAKEQAVLVKFVGWGGLKRELADAQYNLIDEGVMTREEYHRASQSTLNAHYTSPGVIAALWDAVRRLGFERGRVLEPSMGVGHFIGLAPSDIKPTQIAGVELDTLTGRIAKLLYPQSRVQVAGFQDAQLPNNYFDLAISNIPFGNYKVADPASKIPPYVRDTVHNYFFAKAIQKVRPGGLIAFITTHGTLDAAMSTPVRGYLAKSADFLGAIRLPDTAFKANAGTEVVTDIVLMRRRAHGEPDRSLFTDWTGVEYRYSSKDNPKGIPISKYFLEHPERVIGKMGAQGTMYGGGGAEISVKYDGKDIDAQVVQKLNGLADDIVKAGLGYSPDPVVVRSKPAEIAPSAVIEQMFYVNESGDVRQRLNGQGEIVDKPRAQIQLLKQYITLRDAFRSLVATMRDEDATDAQVTKARGPMARAYDAFVAKHGPLHEAANVKLLLDDPFGPSVLAIEEWTPESKKAAKAAIFRQRTVQPDVRVKTADSPAHALSVSLSDTGGITWGRISGLLGLSVDESKQALLDAGRVFEQPDGTYEITERYLSGRVRDKLAEARTAAALDDKFVRNVTALEQVQPIDLKPDRISAHLGAPWVPLETINQFMQGHLGGSRLEAHYRPATAEWAVTETAAYRYRDDRGSSRQWNTERVDLRSMMDATLNNQRVVVKDSDGTTQAAPTIEAQQKQEALKKEFKRWLWSDNDRATSHGRIYNDLHNATVLATYDGSHLTLPGMSDVWRDQLDAHQRNMIWRAILEGNSYVAHTMGAGKTVVMAAIAMESRRLGLASKPIIVIPKQTLSDYARFAEFYPNARVLIGTKAQTEGAARKQFMARIATGDYDAIVVTRDAMVRMPASSAAWASYINEQLDELRMALAEEDAAKVRHGAKRGRLSDLAKKIERLEAKLDEIKKKAEARKDQGLSWEDLGVDMILVDEAHAYRKMTLVTQLRDVAGVPTGTGSGRADDLFIKARQIAQNTPGRNLVFASGTPLVNSVAELYILQRFLQPAALKMAGVEKFDAWAATFGQVVTKYEADVTGTRLRLKPRFSEFSNLNGLIQMFRSVMDVMTAEDLRLPVPPVTGGEAHLTTVNAGEELREYIKGLAQRVTDLDPQHREIDNMLKISTDGRKAALDLRMVGIPPGGHKMQAIAENVVAKYKAWDSRKGTQLVFMELGIPEGSTFSTYADLKRRLVSGGIRAHEIAFIQEAGKSDAKRDALMARMRSGDLRVLIGPRETMGTGVNVQKRLVAMHHADPHWLPALIEQADGRGIRQGNIFFMDGQDQVPGFSMDVDHYVTKGSFDAFMWQAVSWKGKMINQALRGNLSLDRVEEIGGGAVFNAAEIAAIATGNPVMIERMQLEQQIAELHISSNAYERDMYDRRRVLATTPGAIAAHESHLKALDQLDKDLAAPSMDVAGAPFSYDELEQADEALRERLGKVESLTDALSLEGAEIGRSSFGESRAIIPVGSVAGFTMSAVYTVARAASGGTTLERQLALSLPAPSTSVWSNGLTMAPVTRLVTEMIPGALRGQRTRAVDALARASESLAEAEKNKDLVFADQSELDAAKARLAEINTEMGRDASEAQPADEGKEEPEPADGDDEAADSILASMEDDEPRSRIGRSSRTENAEGAFGEDDDVRTGSIPERAGGGSLVPIDPAGETRIDVARPIEFPELVTLATALIGTPAVVRSFRKEGTVAQFRGSGGRGSIRLHAGLFKAGQEQQLAKALAHEIGHLKDWLPTHTLKRGNLIGRLFSLDTFLKGTFTDEDGTTIKNKQVRAELTALSDAWRPWDRDTATASFRAYRHSSKELYADAISVLLNNPGKLQAEAPLFYRTFFQQLDRKPEAKRAYFLLQEWLTGTPDELAKRRYESDLQMFGGADEKAIDIERRRLAEREASRKDIWLRARIQTIDKNVPFIDRVKALEKAGTPVPQDEDPRYFLEERNYIGGKLKAFTEKHIQPIYRSVMDAEIPWHAFGAALMYERVISGDRSEMANPGGTSPAVAQQKYDHLKASLTVPQRKTLETAIAKFRDVVRGVAAEAHEAGLYTDELYEEMVKNPAYAAYRVVDHIEDEVSWRVHKQKGTLKDIANPADSTILKTLATIRAIERQKMLTASFDFLEQHYPQDIEQATEQWQGKGRRPVESKDPKKVLVYYHDQGRLRGKYVDPYIAGSLTNESIGQNWAVVSALRFINGKWFRPVFTTMNLGFQSFNVARDFLRFYMNVPTMTLGRAVLRYWDAIPMAKVRAFGLSEKPSAKELRAYEDLLEAEEAKILSVTFNDLIAGRRVEDTQIEDTLAKVGVGNFSVRQEHAAILKPLMAVLDWITSVGDFIETLPKAAAIAEYQRRDLPPGVTRPIASIRPEDRSHIRRKVGSPDFLAGGTFKPVSNEVFLFSNAITQAIRSDIEVATDPKTRSGYWWKTAALNVAPKLALFAAIYGLAAIDDDDDEGADDWLLKSLRGISEYDLTNYIPVPLGVDSQGNSIYLRLPQADAGRLVGGLTWKLLKMFTGERDVLGSAAQVLDYTAGQFPGLTPVFGVAGDVVQFASGGRVYDPFRNRFLFTEDEMRAGGTRALTKFLKYEFQEVGGGILMRFDVVERPRDRTAGQKALELPIVSNVLGRWIKISNYGEVERLRQAQGTVQRDEAQVRLNEKDAVADAVRDLMALPSTARTPKALHDKATAVVDALYASEPAAEKNRQRADVLRKLRMGMARGQSDPVVDAVMGATSNAQKAAIIQRARRSMSAESFDAWMQNATEQRVVSPALRSLVNRMGTDEAENESEMVGVEE